jgi:CheY-like chemotaxis protein
MRDHLGAATAVIGLMPGARADARETCLEKGADDVLTMPCEAREVSEVLMRHLPALDEVGRR